MHVSNKFFLNKGPYIINQLADLVECEVIGNGELLITGIATINNANPSEITFLANPKYREHLKTSNAGACVINEADLAIAPNNMVLLVTSNPHLTYAKLVNVFYQDLLEEYIEKLGEYISPAAFIDKSAEISSGCYIEPGVYIGRNAKVGEGCRVMANAYIGNDVVIGNKSCIGPNSTLIHCIIGDRCIIHPGVRIGSDGFGFALGKKEILKIPQLGGVIIEDDVEIGSNSCIDRGSIDDTIIRKNTKIDNLVQIAHNVCINENCLIAAQVGIAGSTVIGSGTMIGGQAGIVGHVHIGEKTVIAAQSGVMNDVIDNASLGGTPAVNIQQWHRQSVFLKNAVKKKNN